MNINNNNNTGLRGKAGRTITKSMTRVNKIGIRKSLVTIDLSDNMDKRDISFNRIIKDRVDDNKVGDM